MGRGRDGDGHWRPSEAHAKGGAQAPDERAYAVFGTQVPNRPTDRTQPCPAPATVLNTSTPARPHPKLICLKKQQISKASRLNHPWHAQVRSAGRPAVGPPEQAQEIFGTCP